MNLEEIEIELKEEELALVDEINELSKKMDELDPEKTTVNFLDSIKSVAIESISMALGVSDILENQISTENLAYNSIDMEREYKSYQKFQKEPDNIGIDYTPTFVPKEQFNNLLSLETNKWNRGNVTGNFFKDKKNPMRKENTDGYTSAYTGKLLKHGEKYDYEHVISASDAAQNPVNKMYLSEKVMREEFINSDENLVVVERNINQSKNDTKSEDIDKWIDGKYNKDNSKTREEGYELKREDIHKTIDKAEEKRKEVLLKHGGEKKLNKDAFVKAGKTAIGNSVKAGMKAAFGKLISITITEVIEEYKRKEESSFSQKISNIKKRIISKTNDIIETFKDFSISSFISTLLDLLLKSLFKIAKNIFKFVKTGIYSILKAIKVIFSSEYTWKEKMNEVVKIIGASLVVMIGIALDELIEKAIVSVFPFMAGIAGFVSPIISGLITGIGTVLVLQAFDKFSNNNKEFKLAESKEIDNNIKLAKINLVKASVSTAKATENVNFTIQLFGKSVSIIDSCKKEIDMALSSIEEINNDINSSINSINNIQDETDDLLSQLKTI